MEPIFIIGAVIGVVVLYILITYNQFAGATVNIRASVQEIGNQLKRQMELIPNLETSAKGYLKHERAIFKDLTEARKAVAQAQKSGKLEDVEKASTLISGILPRLQVVVEDNPQIKGADVVRQLMEELRDTADKVMFARRTLIDLTADYNRLRVQFPSNMVAGIFGFQEEKGISVATEGSHVEVKAEEVKTPKVDL